ncbi:hypothetical protein CR513_29940, partial [Mucuna pruriens]
MTYFLQICISSIFPEVEDINVIISHAADSIGMKEIPKYEVKVNEEDWMKRSQANLCFFHSSFFLFIVCFSCYITEEIKPNESFRPVQVTEGLWVVPKWCTPPFGAALAVGVDIDSEAIASASQNASMNIGPDKM